MVEGLSATWARQLAMAGLSASLPVMFRRISSSLGVLLVLTPATAFAMRVEIPADQSLTCFDTKSPAIVLKQVPAGTAALKVRIRSQGDWSNGFGSKTIAYKGEARVAKGAVRYFAGCRNFGWAAGSGAAIEVRVLATDSSGKVLASASDDVFLPDR
jgi:hypothetical protein